MLDSPSFMDQLPEVLLYLAPAAAGAIVMRMINSRGLLYSFVSITGTFVHEMLHLLAGTLTGAQPVSMDLFPRKDAEGRLVMGSVAFANLRWYNAAPSALAPLFGLPLMVWVAWLRVRHGWQLHPADIGIWFALAPQFDACRPSSVDLRLSLISWPLFLLAAVIGWWVWVPHA
jgi:hypothetical protein